jgi:hypothetical protein
MIRCKNCGRELEKMKDNDTGLSQFTSEYVRTGWKHKSPSFYSCNHLKDDRFAEVPESFIVSEILKKYGST